ncbi:MAG: hypothetical protein JWQ10_891, partial [Herbaspirillum sp.]|nr:hypothetical protein [Herbaspirillum sp.]
PVLHWIELIDQALGGVSDISV